MALIIDAPIKKKLMRISLMAVGCALFLSSIFIVFIEVYIDRKACLDDIIFHKTMIEKAVSYPLFSKDKKALEEYIHSLKTNNKIIFVGFYDKSKRPIAIYIKKNKKKDIVYPKRLTVGYKYGLNYISMAAPIFYGNSQAGWIYIQASTKESNRYIIRILITFFTVSAVALFLVYLLLSRLYGLIVSPVSDMANLIYTITKDKNYSLRVAIHTRDEFGAMAAGFNEMLEQIQRRDIELEQYNKYLEEEVAKRTEVLLRLNEQLTLELNKRGQIEKALKELERRYRSLFDNLNDAAFLIDLKTLRIVETNKKGEMLLGKRKDELAGMEQWMLYPAEKKEIYRDSFAGNIERIKRGSVEGIEAEIAGVDGKVIPVEISASLVTIDDKEMLIGLFRDITERKEAEKMLKDSLSEKELLLKEIHHRVKNNMQVISSLLYLQSEKMQDEKAKEIFVASETLIKSMALIHEKLYQSEDLSHINFAEYTKDLTAHLFSTYNVDVEKIRLRLDVEDIHLRIDKAIPCGLIINEILTNALKYAFPEGTGGEIYIYFSKDRTIEPDQPERKERLILVVGDTGIGLPEGIDFKNPGSLGLRLINALVNQLDGKMELLRVGGTGYKITFFQGY